MSSLVLLGGGGHAKVIIEIAKRLPRYSAFQIFDDNFDYLSSVLGHEVSGSLNDFFATAAKFDDFEVLVAIGDNRTRKVIVDRIEANGVKLNFAKLIDPSAIVSPSARFGDGVVVMPGSVINAEAVVAEHSIINTSATIDHDVSIGRFSHIAPGVNLCGSVSVGEGVLMGVGSCAIPGVVIGEWSTIAAGSVVVQNIEPRKLVYGVPAREKNE